MEQSKWNRSDTIPGPGPVLCVHGDLTELPFDRSEDGDGWLRGGTDSQYPSGSSLGIRDFDSGGQPLIINWVCHPDPGNSHTHGNQLKGEGMSYHEARVTCLHTHKGCPTTEIRATSDSP